MSTDRSYRRYLATMAQADLTDRVRSQIELRQGNRCFYCQATIVKRRYVLDHFVPRCLEGEHGPLNRVVACQLCDAAKGPRRPTGAEIRKFIGQVIAGYIR